MPNEASFSVSTEGASVTGKVTDKLPVIPGTPPTGLTTVGPRVTIAPKGEWDANTTYEFYDAVFASNGSSYIAKKPSVPAGTPVTDGEYWAVWTPGDQKLAELQSTVNTFDGRITANAEEIAAVRADAKKHRSVTDYGADNTGAFDSSDAIQACVDESDCGVYFPAGVYKITKTIRFPYNTENVYGIELAPGANIVAASSMTYMFALGMVDKGASVYEHYTISGGVFDGAGLADTAIYTSKTLLETTISGVNCKNCLKAHIYIDADVSKPSTNALIDNVRVNTSQNPQHHTDSIGVLFAGKDNLISNTQIFNCLVGIKSKGLIDCTNVIVYAGRRWEKDNTIGISCDETVNGSLINTDTVKTHIKANTINATDVVIYDFYKVEPSKAFDAQTINIKNLSISGFTENMKLCNESSEINIDCIPNDKISASLSNPGNSLNNKASETRTVTNASKEGVAPKTGVLIGYLPVYAEPYKYTAFCGFIFSRINVSVNAGFYIQMQPTSVTSANRAQIPTIFNATNVHVAIGPTTTIEGAAYQPVYIYKDSGMDINGLYLKPIYNKHRSMIVPFQKALTTVALTKENTIATDKENGAL